jgi:hypothetical protein
MEVGALPERIATAGRKEQMFRSYGCQLNTPTSTGSTLLFVAYLRTMAVPEVT